MRRAGVAGCGCWVVVGRRGDVVVRCLDDDGAGRSRGESCAVGDDVVDGVGGGLCGIDLHRAHLRAVDECRDAEVEVSRCGPVIAHTKKAATWAAFSN